MLNTHNISFDQLPTMVAQLIANQDRLSELLISFIAKNAPSDVDESFIDIHDASKIINKAIPTIYALAAAKKIPCHKQGRQLYFLKSELIAWIKSPSN